MNYKSLLYEIQSASHQGPTPDTIIIPSNKELYSINLDTREIQGPSTLSVKSDHYAETVYFVVDRFYDSMDLSQTNCIVQYVANGESYVYTVPFCDTTTFENKIIIPWTISASATQISGTIKYFIRFYLMDDSAEFIYSLSTLTATSNVLNTLSQYDFVNEDSTLELPSRYMEIVQNLMEIVDNATVYWNDV